MTSSRCASVSTMVASEVELRDQRGGEQHHQQRRLGEEADHHLAPRAQAAERGADVHAGEGDEEAREREQADQRDGVGGGVERQVGAERRHDRRGEREAAEDQVRRGCETAARRCARAPPPCGTASPARGRAAAAPARCLFCSQARHWLTQPVSSGASSTASIELGELGGQAGGAHRMKSSSTSSVREAVHEVDRDAAALQQRDQGVDALDARAPPEGRASTRAGPRRSRGSADARRAARAPRFGCGRRAGRPPSPAGRSPRRCPACARRAGENRSPRAARAARGRGRRRAPRARRAATAGAATQEEQHGL